MRYTDLLAKREMAAATIQQTYFGTKEVDAALKIQEDETAAARAASLADKPNILSFTLLGIVFCWRVVRRKISLMRYTDLLVKREMAATTIQQTYLATNDGKYVPSFKFSGIVFAKVLSVGKLPQ